MKLQLDTTNKKITIESNVLFKDLLELLDKLFKDKEYLDYKIEVKEEIKYISSPIIIERQTTPIWPSYPWYFTSGTTDKNIKYCNETSNATWDILLK